MPVDQGMDWLLAAADLAATRRRQFERTRGPAGRPDADGVTMHRVTGGLEMLRPFMK